ncbi:MAG: hypothetical protein K6G74_03920 [Bacilli bacterium]|nr:hypothetical protein [Bacilli bacterium]
MKNKKLLILGAGALMSIGLLAGCSGQDFEGKGVYTYKTYLSTSPKTWNVHNWETSDESYVTGFTEMGLYDCILNDEKNGYKFVTEMASEMPVDVVDQLSDDEINDYYEGNPTAGMAWDIALNDKACWEDGTKITAKDYVDSMELQLSPRYANSRADGYYGSNLVLVNAENYYKQGRQTIEPFYKYKRSNGTVPDDSGFYFLNLGKYTDYLGTIYGTTDTDTNFYSLLDQVAEQYDVKTEAQRIIHGYSYYLMWYKDHRDDTAWDTVYRPIDPTDPTSEKVGRPDRVSSNIIKEQNVDLELDVFNDGFTNYLGQKDYIKTIKNTTDGWIDSNIETYSRTALENDIKAVVRAVSSRSQEARQEWAWKLPLFTYVYTYEGEPIKFDKVGIRQINDYKFRLYLSRSITSLNLKFALSGNWLVNVPLYKRLSTSLPNSTSLATTYGSNKAENYLSYGPYKLKDFIPGEKISIVRNDKWYGYEDGKHVGQFTMTNIDTRIIAKHETAMAEFLAGRLDDIDLTVTDYRDYGSSGRCTTTYESYTQKISFNTDAKKLLSRQQLAGSGKNKTVLTNKNFRTGLSLGLDRKTFVSNATSGSKGFTGLLNDLYLSNNSTGASYRDTPQGKSVYDMVYGKLGKLHIADADAKLTTDKCGFNHSLAVEYVALGLKEELNSSEAGHLNPNDNINIEFRVYDDESENTIAANNFITSAWTSLIDEAVKQLRNDGTLAANENISISINMVKDQDYYKSARNGGFDMIFSIWGGAAVNPYGLMEVYCKKDFTNCCEYGFTGKQDDHYIAIDANGDGALAATDTDEDGILDSGEEWKSFHGWYSYMVDSDDCNEAKFGDEIAPGDEGYDEYLECHNRKLNVLAGLEAGIINRYECIPLAARGTSSLLGLKTENASKVYINLIGYGGIRFLSFTYDDAEWAKFCSDHGNSLGDIYKSYVDED